jgi:hypothetical protein
MRGVALALLPVLLLAAACTSRPARHDRSGEISYNRRELPPASPGLLTGPDGSWTVSGASAPAAAQQEADACTAAKQQLLDAVSDADFDRAERRVRLLCGD